jgi:hypothetical protein
MLVWVHKQVSVSVPLSLESLTGLQFESNFPKPEKGMAELPDVKDFI